MSRWKWGPSLTLAVTIGCALPALAQSAWQPGHEGIGFGQSTQGKQWVQMVSSPDLTVKSGTQAGRQQEVALRFVIDSGLHINSHNPRSKYLIPTTLTLDPPPGVEIATMEYPQGVDHYLEFDPKNALSVYTGEFGVLVRLHARPGHYTLHGKLHYQACDNRACNPPKTLPLTLDVTAR